MSTQTCFGKSARCNGPRPVHLRPSGERTPERRISNVTSTFTLHSNNVRVRSTATERARVLCPTIYTAGRCTLTQLMKSAVLLTVICVLTAAGTHRVATTGNGAFQQDWHQHLRGIVDRTQNDLTAADQIASGPKDHARNRHAQTVLATFDRQLGRGNSDSGGLKNAISALAPCKTS